jgi:hypothetical protein
MNGRDIVYRFRKFPIFCHSGTPMCDFVPFQRCLGHAVRHFTAGRALILPSVAYDRDPKVTPTYNLRSNFDHRVPQTPKIPFHQYRSPVMMSSVRRSDIFRLWPTLLLPTSPPSCFVSQYVFLDLVHQPKSPFIQPLPFPASSPPPPFPMHGRYVVVVYPYHSLEPDLAYIKPLSFPLRTIPRHLSCQVDLHVVVHLHDQLVIMILPNNRESVLIPIANLVDRRAFVSSLPPYATSHAIHPSAYPYHTDLW